MSVKEEERLVVSERDDAGIGGFRPKISLSAVRRNGTEHYMGSARCRPYRRERRRPCGALMPDGELLVFGLCSSRPAFVEFYWAMLDALPKLQLLPR